MPPFHYLEPHSLDEAVALLSQPGAVAMGGGTDLLPQVNDGIVPAARLVGLAAIPGMAAIAETADGLTIGAAATITDVAAHPLVRRRYVALAEAAGRTGHAADSQRGHHRRQPESAAPLLVLPQPADSLSQEGR